MKIDNNQKKRLKDFLIKKIKQESDGLVIIETPYSLEEADTAHFKLVFPQYKDKYIETRVNHDLIGGFIIRHGSTVIDASVNSSINNLVAKLD